MPEGVRVDSIDALKVFRIALFKFAEAAQVALGDAESEMQRTLGWLERDQLSHWTGQIRKRTEALSRAKEALRMKKVFKDSGGRTPSAVDEEKAVALAMRRLAEAEQKLQNTKAHSRKLYKEIMQYKGGVQRFATAVGAEIPMAVSRLDGMVAALEAYVTLAPADGATPTGALTEPNDAPPEASAPAMSRPEATTASPEPAAVDVSTDAKTLRRLTPPVEARAAAPPADGAAGPWRLTPVGELHRSALAALTVDWDPPDPRFRVTIAAGVRDAATACLVRLEPTSEGDSGWYIGPAGGAPVEQVESISVHDLLAVRPDLGDILAMPQGYLIVAGAAGVRGVYDAADRDLWSGVAPQERSAGSPS